MRFENMTRVVFMAMLLGTIREWKLSRRCDFLIAMKGRDISPSLHTTVPLSLGLLSISGDRGHLRPSSLRRKTRPLATSCRWSSDQATTTTSISLPTIPKRREPPLLVTLFRQSSNNFQPSSHNCESWFLRPVFAQSTTLKCRFVEKECRWKVLNRKSIPDLDNGYSICFETEYSRHHFKLFNAFREEYRHIICCYFYKNVKIIV